MFGVLKGTIREAKTQIRAKPCQHSLIEPSVDSNNKVGRNNPDLKVAPFIISFTTSDSLIFPRMDGPMKQAGVGMESRHLRWSRVRFYCCCGWLSGAILLSLCVLPNSAVFAQNYSDYAAWCRENGGTPYPSPARCIFGGSTASSASGTNGYSALGTAIGNAIGCAIFHGPGCPQRRNQEQIRVNMAAENAREAAALEEQRRAEAANDAALAAAAAERARLAHEQFLADRDQLTRIMRGEPSAPTGLRSDDSSIEGLRGDDGSSLPVLREDATPDLLSGSPRASSLWGKEPPLPTSVGNSLPSDMTPSVDGKDATDYFGRAVDFLRQNIETTAINTANKSALSGEMFAETEMGPYGITTVVMVNVAQLPNFVMDKVSGVVTGRTSYEEGQSLTIQSANRIFDLNSPVNDAIKSGPLDAAHSVVTDSIEKSAKANLASLAAECLPVKDQEREELVQNSLQVANTATAAFKYLFTTENDKQ